MGLWTIFCIVELISRINNVNIYAEQFFSNFPMIKNEDWRTYLSFGWQIATIICLDFWYKPMMVLGIIAIINKPKWDISINWQNQNTIEQTMESYSSSFSNKSIYKN